MSLHRVDPVNLQLRRHHAVRRREYHVPGPNSLWHIDGNHKLIRWRIVVHGGIDGFSRLCLFMQASSNNRAATVAERFIDATNEFGWPSRVRTDHGRENVEVARLMLTRRGCNRGSHLTGSSIRNQRIERLWRDFFRCVGSLFYSLFYHLEDNHLLDPDNEIDIYCLHYVFLQRLNLALDRFKSGWNSHKITTECEFTPFQLFIQGMMRRFGGDNTAVRDVFDAEPVHPEEFGYDPDGPVPPLRTNNNVAVPSTRCPLTAAELEELRGEVQPWEPCSNYGISLYIATREFVNNRIQNA